MTTDLKINNLAFSLAREACGHTQTSLARAADVSQAAISQIESGQLQPSAEVLGRIGRALGYPESFFRQPFDFRQLPPSFYRRRITDLPQKTIKSARANMNIFRQQLRTLLDAMELPPVRVPFLDLDELALSAEKAALEVRRLWDVPPGPIDNLTTLVERAGIVVVKWDFGTSRMDGFSTYEPAGDLPPLIFVNARLPADHCRFTLAHELGHLVMHVHLPLVRAEARDIEEDANQFGSSLLMPAGEIRGHLSGLSVARLAQLKPFWKVSMASLLYRAKTLDRVSEHQYTRLWQQLAPYRTVEPNELSPEEPTLLAQVVRLHLEQLGYSEADLVKALHTNAEALRSRYPLPKPQGGLRVVQS